MKTSRHPSQCPTEPSPSPARSPPQRDACDLLLPKGQGEETKNPITRAWHRCLKAPDSPAGTWYQKNKSNPPAKPNHQSCRPIALAINHGLWAPARATSAAPGHVCTVLTKNTSSVPMASSCTRTWGWMHKRYFLNKSLDNRQHLPPSLSPHGMFFLSHLKKNVSYAAHYF